MLVVYNNAALFVLIISALLTWLVSLLSPDGWFTGPISALVFLSITTLISALCEASSFKPRIFWLPMVLWALPFLAYGAHNSYGRTGLVVMAIAIAIIFGLIFYAVFKLDKLNWTNAQSTFATIKSQPLEPGNAKLWAALNDSLYTPIVGKYTPEVCEHNLQVATVAGCLVSDEERQAHVEGYKQVINQGLAPSDQKFKMSKVQVARLCQLLEQKAKNPNAIAQLEQVEA